VSQLTISSITFFLEAEKGKPMTKSIEIKS